MPAGRPSDYTEELTYIYYLCSPVDGIPVYIGKTINPKQRLLQHISKSKYNYGKLSKWISSLLSDEITPELKIIACALGGWEELEIQLIAQYREEYKLLNTLSGGNQPVFSDCKTKKRLREMHQRMGIALKQGYVSEATKIKLKKGAVLYPDIMGRYADISI